MLWCGVVSIMSVRIASQCGLYVNLTPSLPRGLYRVIHAPLRRGTIVLVCLSDSIGRWGLQRGYLSTGSCPGDVMPLGKCIRGIGGDTVIKTARAVAINGRVLDSSRTVMRDRQGRSVPAFPDTMLVLHRDDVWLAGVAARSWDSRYFGPIHRQQIRAVLTPVMTID